GIVGRLFREFAVTLSVAIAVSLVISLTATPMMCARLLRPQSRESHGRLYRASERGFAWILSGYETSLGWVLKHQPFTILITLATMAATIFLYAKVPKGFFPQQDSGRLTGTIQADQDTSFQSMQKKLGQFVRTVMRDPDVESANGFLGGGTVNAGRMFISLKPRSERKATADQIIARLRGKLSRVPGATLYDAVGQRPVSTMYTPLNQYHVVMQVESKFWQNPEGLKFVYVRGKTGELVPLDAFARYERSTAPLAVNHHGQFPSVTISF